ncbi:acyl-CoA synthetase [Maritimibacter sp. UBA3975]|uniref:acyl-CoA synthetase n=1 Tax=Maritimibacter sp. UBA3975 TaxID=1946833 RepID=UPI000C098987|nr:acyl-CoA synthetase [Maritimibacter sp. UBA3975]MAM63350.1 acyl-CoA synthetase [Maritimibacter sp.]|tara:strand:- start:10359 stop:11927 length:1569 start_codon:yes stop_codon:yes gene_type:complete
MTDSQAQIARAGRDTIADALSRATRRFGDATALHFADRTWSFSDLYDAAGRVAAHLLAAGLSPGDRVAAYGRNSDAYLVLYLACCRGGFIHVPINYALVGRELRYILDNSGAQALFVDPALADLADDVLSAMPPLALTGTLHGGANADVLRLAQDSSIAVPADLGEAIGPEDLVQLLYTSGTTAAPKGAMMSHRALLAEYTSCIVELGFSSADRALAGLPLYHSAQMHVFTLPQFLVGATTWLIEAPAPDLCLDLIERHAITSFFAPPTVWISLLRAPAFDERDLTSLQYVYYGASIMPVPVLQELRERLPGAAPYNCYGQSEIGPLATVLRPEEHADRPASAGRPIYNVETRLVDEDMRDVAPGEQGEIVHRSPQLLSGYWDKPEATAEAFAGGWFHSGDVGVRDEAGYITIVDRTKDIIKTGGTMVASREVEEVLFTHPAVHEVAVIALPHEKWVEAVTAVIVLRDGAEVTEAELHDFAAENLAGFKLPKAVVFTDELPRNTAGKILKRELREAHKTLFG